MRVNSPGGSALASDLIWHEIDLLAREKPVVISMGNVAASGGYYISCIPSPIFVDQTTITGSIGVFGGKPNLAGLYGKLGVYSEIHSRGQNAAMYSMSQPFTPEQKQKLRFELSEFYRGFTEKVASARALTADSVNAIGRGQVWTGKEAIANGLADRTGGLFQAIEEVCRTCGIDRNNTEIVTIPQKHYLIKNPFDLPALMTHAFESVFGHGKSASALTEFATDAVLFRMPYDIDVK
jgi:protease-4